MTVAQRVCEDLAKNISLLACPCLTSVLQCASGWKFSSGYNATHTFDGCFIRRLWPRPSAQRLIEDRCRDECSEHLRSVVSGARRTEAAPGNRAR